ncbi:MAG TPA: prolyl oligopeptidase family serine peptidase [Verrucomicrobiae bacterium]|nr:prolyl oligopeptidase family serine peptidase [Verrucomicrobiae bacterium]
MMRSLSLLLAVFPFVLQPALKAESSLAEGPVITLREGLILKAKGRIARTPFHVDAVEEMIVKGEWTPPVAGQAFPSSDNTNRVWKPVTASTDGVFTNRELEGGYVYTSVESERSEVKLLRAAGQEVVYVNGEPRPGDPYSNGILALPVELRPGTNDFLFRVNRGKLKASLATPARPIMLYLGDPTVPDIVHGDNKEAWGALVVINCTTNFLNDLSLKASLAGRGSMESFLPSIPPLSVRKVGFRFKPHWNDTTNQVELNLKLWSHSSGSKLLDSASLPLHLRRETEHYNQTFRSDIDGSIQYYAVAPAQPKASDPPAKALFLSVHGASVEASGQAAAYASKRWGTLVAPTNRRSYGFDWEDWGRHDAMEVLSLAKAKYQPDPQQIYLTGHSMGGHGTWQLGVTYPDHFAAIGPSAGWISFRSYGGGEWLTNGDAMQQMVQRATNPGDTLGLVSNCLHFGVYILHGDQDDNVPVEEARTMRDRLTTFHHDFMYHEQPGAGHWWGNLCVDWPPLFDLFARHKIPEDRSVCDINFSTMNPGISSSSHWVSIEAQQHALNKSSVVIHYDPMRRAFDAATENVARLKLRPASIAAEGAVSVTIDGQKLSVLSPTGRDGKIWFENKDNQWVVGDAPPLAWKGPHRYGPFKEAFGHDVMFVYGTKGSPAENAWAKAKCRCDAETWWYRANGSVDVVPDVAFDAAKEPDRGVVLYGNADNNAAWPALLSQSPVQVRRGQVEIGTRVIRGEDLACLLCRPRPGSDRACVAVVAGTGIVGSRLTDRVPYFTAGVAYPDCTVFGVDTLSKGIAGVRAAGFFGMDWNVAKGDFVWRD